MRGDALHSVVLAADEASAPAAPRLLFRGPYLSEFESSTDGDRLLMERKERSTGGTGPLVKLQGLLPPTEKSD